VLQAHGLRSGYFRGNLTTYDTTLGDVLDTMHDRSRPDGAIARRRASAIRSLRRARRHPQTALSIPTPPVRRIG